jgi:NADPH:quinone reductase-like Zn-dependent oxidoreductase
MKAVVLQALGEVEGLRYVDVADPVPGEGEALVRLRAASLNRRDVWIRRGLYPRINLPVILGSDGAGEVVEVGPGVDASLKGQAVVIDPGQDWGPDERAQSVKYRIYGLPDDGTYAQLIKAPAANLHPKPGALSFEEAAAIPLAGLTAYRAVVTRAKVEAGETIIVTGIGGGVATFALQFARHLGARVFVTSGSDQKLAQAGKLGADGGVNNREGDWGKAILERIGHPPDVVIDSIGGGTINKAIEILRPGGRIVSYGATAGLVDQFDLRRLFWKQINLLGSTMGTAREFGEMIRLYDRAGLHPAVDRLYSLEQADEAHTRMEESEQFGKIVLRID